MIGFVLEKYILFLGRCWNPLWTAPTIYRSSKPLLFPRLGGIGNHQLCEWLSRRQLLMEHLLLAGIAINKILTMKYLWKQLFYYLLDRISYLGIEKPLVLALDTYIHFFSTNSEDRIADYFTDMVQLDQIDKVEDHQQMKEICLHC